MPPRRPTGEAKERNPGKKSRPPGSGHADLIRQLWEAAVNLRGSIEPGDYKRYVLPIIFLRFLSLRYERRRHNLTRHLFGQILGHIERLAWHPT